MDLSVRDVIDATLEYLIECAPVDVASVRFRFVKSCVEHAPPHAELNPCLSSIRGRVLRAFLAAAVAAPQR
jgi:hypothetical protein